MNSSVELAEAVRPNRSTANVPQLPTLELAEHARTALARAAQEVIVQLRLAENATARVRKAVAYAGQAVKELKGDARVLAVMRAARSERSLVAEACRNLGHLETLTSLEVAGLESDLARARRTAETHRQELERFFIELDGRSAGHAFGLRLRLMVHGAFSSSRFEPRCRLLNRLTEIARSARRAAEEVGQLRARIDERTDALREAVADITADVAGVAVELERGRGRASLAREPRSRDEGGALDRDQLVEPHARQVVERDLEVQRSPGQRSGEHTRR